MPRGVIGYVSNTQYYYYIGLKRVDNITTVQNQSSKVYNGSTTVMATTISISYR